VLQSIDIGLVVLDRDYKVQVWNSFMANHSGLPAQNVINKPFLQVFRMCRTTGSGAKVESVRMLKNRAFNHLGTAPVLLRFKNYRPITGAAEHMYQNITFVPLTKRYREVDHIGVVINDVTDIANEPARSGSRQSGARAPVAQ